MSDEGLERAARWYRLVSRALNDPPDPAAWSERTESMGGDPGDGSPSSRWDRLLELARTYSRDPSDVHLWEMGACLYDLARWYLERPVTVVSGIGPTRAQTLERLDVETLRDLVLHVPRSYSDRRFLRPIRELRDGEDATIRGEVVQKHVRRGRRPRLEVRLGDETGVLTVNFWNQLYLDNQIRRGQTLICTGRVETFRNNHQMNNPDYEVQEGEDGTDGAIRAIYPGTEGLSQKRLRRWIQRALERTRPLWIDCLPPSVRARQKLPERRTMLEVLHEPASPQQLEEARRRFVFEEFFWYQLVMLRYRWHLKQQTPSRSYPRRDWLETFLGSLPFELTDEQSRALTVLEEELTDPAPMNRLLQGDVGTGKTIVAAASLLRVVNNGYQAALMAPTELLAKQHFDTLSRRFRKLPVEVTMLVGDRSDESQSRRLRAVREGDVDVVVGTHALLTDRVRFSDLGYAIIDEQHRFGVEQRRRLREKGSDPDLLIVSATPIPRSLARTTYADLSVTTLDTYPTGPRNLETKLVDDTEEGRTRVYERLNERLEASGRAFLVYPAIEDGEDPEIRGAQSAYRRARERNWFPDHGVGLLHGRMDRGEMQSCIEAFRSGEVRVLLSTTVIEIGLDVPRATHLIVHQAERFGLAQLHQLRGRVGRGGQKARALLMVSPETSSETRERLAVLTRTNDGLEVAREDLRRRGAGNPAGRRQAGSGPFERGDPWRDRDIMKSARQEAGELLRATEGLTTPDSFLIRRKLARDYETERRYVSVN